MSRTVRPSAGPGRDVRELCLAAPNLRLACRSLLEECEARVGIGRAAIVTRHRDQVDGVAAGLPQGVLETLLAQIGSSNGAPGSHKGRDSLPSLQESLPDLPELRGLTCLPFRMSSAEFAGSVWLETEPDAEEGAILRELLDEAAPALARLAEIDALRRELGRYRDEAVHIRRIFDSLPDPVIVMSEASQVRLSNRRADELLIAAPAESFGRRRAVETNNLFFSAFRARAILGGDERRELFLVDPRDGSDLLFEVEVLEISSAGGPEPVTIFILRDITDLKRATTELEAEYGRSVAAQHRSRRESERLNVILANAGIPILVTDDRSDIMLMNHEAERLFEAPPAPGDAVSSDVRTNDARITGLISDFLLQEEPRREVEVQLREPTRGTQIPARVVLTKILNRRHEPIAVVCVIHDLTEAMEVQRLADELRTLNTDLEARIRAATVELSKRNRELERKSRELVEASRLKSEFLAMMSHELRTPISSVLGFNTLLREEIFGPLTSGQRQTLDKMRSASDHLLKLINDVLDLSQVEAGKLSVEPHSFELSAFVEELAETIRPMAREKGLAFELELAPDLPPAYADPTRLRQVVLNLASNAVKFTNDGHVVLRTSHGDDDGRVRLEVEDTGIGIEPEHLEGIFEEFRQIDRFTTREHGGTGLGLAISRRLIDLMEGQLSVESEPGVGSTFRVELPVAVEAERRQSLGQKPEAGQPAAGPASEAAREA